MVTFGQGEDAHYWVEENKDKPGDITTFLLFPAAKAGQLKTLEKFIQFGKRERECVHILIPLLHVRVVFKMRFLYGWIG